MAIAKIITLNRSDNFNNIEEFVLDNEQDFSFLPQNAPAGSEAYLTNRSKIWHKSPSLGWVPESGGGGGTSDLFVITLTGVMNDMTFEMTDITCDKTTSEIKEAIESQKKCLALLYCKTDEGEQYNTTFSSSFVDTYSDDYDNITADFIFRSPLGLEFYIMINDLGEAEWYEGNITDRYAVINFNYDYNTQQCSCDWNDYEEVLESFKDDQECNFQAILHINGLVSGKETMCRSTNIIYTEDDTKIRFMFNVLTKTYIVSYNSDGTVTCTTLN